MLTSTHLNGNRIVAIFPCVGGNGDEQTAYVQDMIVVTTDDHKPRRSFDVYTQVRPDARHVAPYPPKRFTTFPSALRHARQMGGWG